MTLREFIKAHRAELDECINRAMGCSRKHDASIVHKRNDDERRQWILNDEGLYNWARSKGVSE